MTLSATARYTLGAFGDHTRSIWGSTEAYYQAQRQSQRQFRALFMMFITLHFISMKDAGYVAIMHIYSSFVSIVFKH